MEKGKLQKTRVRILLTVLTACMMALIFFFSTENADQSNETSGIFTIQVLGVLYPDYSEYPDTEQTELFDKVQVAVRKTAHFTEYTVLGCLIRLCLESWFGKRQKTGTAAWTSGTLYACTDELHQIATDGRSGQWYDVLIDSAGVLTGVLITIWILRMIRNRKKGRGTEETCP